MVLVGWASRARRDRVDVDVEQARAEGHDVVESDLLADLTARGLEDRGVVGLDVPSRLQPEPELRVEDEEQLGAVGAEDERARSEMARSVILPRERGLALFEQRAHALEVVGLAGICREVPVEQRGEVAESRGRHGKVAVMRGGPLFPGR